MYALIRRFWFWFRFKVDLFMAPSRGIEALGSSQVEKIRWLYYGTAHTNMVDLARKMDTNVETIRAVLYFEPPYTN